MPKKGKLVSHLEELQKKLLPNRYQLKINITVKLIIKIFQIEYSVFIRYFHFEI